MGEPICEAWVREAAKGATFAEVGGLWGTINEQVTTAALAGAASTAMIDIAPQEGPDDLWGRFRNRAAQMGVSGTTLINGSIDDPATLERVGNFEVVCCNGVLYHCAEPLRTLGHLRSITSRTLILGTVTMPELITNTAGRLSVEAGAALLVPSMNASQLAVAGQWLRDLGDIQIQADGLTHPAIWEADNYDPWWWLFTRDHVVGLLRAAGFELEAVASYWQGRATIFRARAVCPDP
jgi:hypothetical protein